MPPQFGTFKQAQRVQQVEAAQPELGFGSFERIVLPLRDQLIERVAFEPELLHGLVASDHPALPLAVHVLPVWWIAFLFPALVYSSRAS